jgi:hypothetical protein
MKVRMWVENNSKFVRGKGGAREETEGDVMSLNDHDRRW